MDKHYEELAKEYGKDLTRINGLLRQAIKKEGEARNEKKYMEQAYEQAANGAAHMLRRMYEETTRTEKEK